MNLVKEDLLGIHKDRMKIGASLADVDPMQIDKTVKECMKRNDLLFKKLRDGCLRLCIPTSLTL